jgi:hypothetical protein
MKPPTAAALSYDQGGCWLNGIGEAHFFSRRFDKAAANLLASLERAPSFPVTYRILAACYAHLGRLAGGLVVA